MRQRKTTTKASERRERDRSRKRGSIEGSFISPRRSFAKDRDLS